MDSYRRVAVLIVVLLIVASGQSDDKQSGCELCASTGDCSRAYRGESGQFCGNWLDRMSDRRPCCCPDDAVCKVSNYACNCGYVPHHADDGGDGLGCWHVAVLILVLLNIASGQSDDTQSGCEVCASTGDCSRAYQGESGQFCGNWLDRKSDRRPCCCPDNAVCKVSNYACNCGYTPHYTDDGGRGLVWLWWLLGSLALLLCCCGCCFMVSKRVKDRGRDDAIPVAAPVAEGVSSQPYGTTSTAYASAPADAGYVSATPAYDRYYSQSRGGAA
ncbi:hypothetical protein GQ600_23764 [Phytophthora cactorum]|nr:hypothetical protein GQ600_23764 [Phytophthora cactorum]